MRKFKAGDTITVESTVIAYSATARKFRDRQLLPGVRAEVFAVAPCVYGLKHSCGKAHQTFYAVEFKHADGMRDRAGVMPCNALAFEINTNT